MSFFKIILLILIAFLLITMANSIYYMYYYKETVAFITSISMENKFFLFLPVDRYAVTLISTEQHFQAQKTISGKILFNEKHLSTFNFSESDINIGPVTESNSINRRPNKLYPDTHDIPGYYYLKKIFLFSVENHNSCTLEIIFDSVPDNILLKIETYLQK